MALLNKIKQPSTNTNTDANFDLVVFDLDGVLIDSLEVMETAFFRAFDIINKDNKLPRPLFSEYKKHLGLGFPRIMELMNLPIEMHPHFKEQSNRLMDKIRIFPGVVDMCQSLQAAGVKMTIATGKDGVRARKVLQHLKLDTYFSLILGSDEVVNPKPGPDMIFRGMEHNGITDKSRVLMCGDAIADLQSGRAAGVKILSVSWGEGKPEQLQAFNPDYFVDSPGSLTEAVLL
ncbi:MAG: HAD-IA family hydrolase [Aestuariibacter sp.]